MAVNAKDSVITILTAIFGIASTYAINIYAGQGPVISASLICLIGGLFFGNYAGINNSGAFAGMSSRVFVPSIVYTLFDGLLVGALWIVLIKSFLGYGGKQGTIAFIGVSVSSFILYFINPVTYFNLNAYLVVGATYVILVVAFSAIGTVSTLVLQEKVIQKTFKKNDGIIGAALIGLIAGFLIPTLPLPYSSTLPAVVAAGSYAGMSSRNILKNDVDFLAVGMITGIVFIALLPVSIECGGKLGTSAFLAVNLWKLLKK